MAESPVGGVDGAAIQAAAPPGLIAGYGAATGHKTSAFAISRPGRTR